MLIKSFTQITCRRRASETQNECSEYVRSSYFLQIFISVRSKSTNQILFRSGTEMTLTTDTSLQLALRRHFLEKKKQVKKNGFFFNT